MPMAWVCRTSPPSSGATHGHLYQSWAHAIPWACRRCNDVFRNTPLTDAVVELFVCSHAVAFKGSYYSSFSDAIMRLREVHGRASDRDEHDTQLPSWHDRHGSPDESVPLDHPALAAMFAALDAADDEPNRQHTLYTAAAALKDRCKDRGVAPQVSDIRGP